MSEQETSIGQYASEAMEVWRRHDDMIRSRDRQLVEDAFLNAYYLGWQMALHIIKQEQNDRPFGKCCKCGKIYTSNDDAQKHWH